MGLYRIDAMTALIRTTLKESSDTVLTDAIILQAINDGQKEVASRAFCIEHEDTVTTVAGSRLVPFSGHRVEQVGGKISPIISKPQTGVDDSYVNLTYGSITTTELKWWWPSYESNRYGLVRSPNINIDQGTVISSAAFDIYGKANSYNISSKVIACAADNPAAPTTYSEYTALSWGVANTNFILSSADRAKNSVDVTALVQQSLNRPGFVSGNAVLFRIAVNGQGGNLQGNAYSFDDGNAAYYPTLTVNILTVNRGLLKIIPSVAGHASISGNAPQYWFQWGNNIVIEPVPDAAYSLTLSVSDYPSAALTLDIEYPTSLPDEFHPCIVDFACYVLSLKLHNWKQAGEYYNRYIANLKKRKQEYIEHKAEKRLIHTQPNIGG